MNDSPRPLEVFLSLITPRSPLPRQAALSLAGLLSGSLSPTLGLDLEGGVSVILKAPDGTSADTMEQARANIDRRVNALGVAEPDISVQGTNIEVQLPGLAKGTIEQRPKAQSCIESADKTAYGCFADHAAAQTAFGTLKVEESTQQVCITGDDPKQIFPCFTGDTAEKDAAAALDGITVQAQTSGTTTGQYCLQDASGAQFGCFPNKKAADAAKANKTIWRLALMWRAVAALAADPAVVRRSGRTYAVGDLAREYGFTDLDGRQPTPYLIEE
jgi:preprotein translocase subunit SecD